MQRFRNILVGIDLSNADREVDIRADAPQPAGAASCHLARRSHARQADDFQHARHFRARCRPCCRRS